MENYRELGDSELAVLLQQSDHGAFTEIYNRYWEALFRHARRMLDDDRACDIVQDIFTNLYVKPPAGEMTSLKAYLYTAVRNKVLDQIRKDKLNIAYLTSLGDLTEKGESNTERDLDHQELAALIDREIGLLPEKMRQTFELSRKSNLSYKEIAREMNTSDETVKKQISRALARLRIKLSSVTRFLFF